MIYKVPGVVGYVSSNSGVKGQNHTQHRGSLVLCRKEWGVQPEVAGYQRKPCGAHNTGKGKSLTLQPVLIRGWRHQRLDS